MKKNWPEIVLSSKENRMSKVIGRAVREGVLRKIAPRIYTSNLTNTPEEVIKRNRYQLLGLLFPLAVISHRSALEGGISPDGNIVLSYKYTKVVKLPGLTVRLIRGPGPDPEDTPFLENLYIASRGRAFLENLKTTRSRSGFVKSTQEQSGGPAGPHGAHIRERRTEPLSDPSKSRRLQTAQNKTRIPPFGQNYRRPFGYEPSANSRAQPFDPSRVELFRNSIGLPSTGKAAAVIQCDHN